jgi:outer membrane lipoprotein SlyB
MLGLVACAGMTPSERSAAAGAAIGGVAGAAIGEDAGSAALGAVLGGAAGWYLGCREEGRCGNVDNRRQYYDRHSGRYYFYDRYSDRYFFENGEPYPYG